MNSLLRIYLVLIFAGSALEAGSEDDSIKLGFTIEAANFPSPSYPQNLEGLADCLNPSVDKGYSAKEVTLAEYVSE